MQTTIGGSVKTVDEMAKLSVRELVAGLSQVEDARRRARQAAATGPASTHQADAAALAHRERVIVGELRRRARARRVERARGRAAGP